jgi:hypothetical protein
MIAVASRRTFCAFFPCSPLICRDELLISAHLSSQRGDFNLPGLERIYKQSVAEREIWVEGKLAKAARAHASPKSRLNRTN